jgi:hypothetical protein
MKRFLLSGLGGLALFSNAAMAVDTGYTNTGSAYNVQVDAVNFVNKGLFQAVGSLPYETSDTLNFINQAGTYSGSGLMTGTPGFRFCNTSSTTG